MLGWATVMGGLAGASSTLSVAQAGPAAASPSETWELKTLRSGFCIHFLADPALASRGAFEGAQLITAAADDSLHPALRRAIQASPEFATWIPSRFCFYQFASIHAAGKDFTDSRPDRAQVIAVWSMPVAANARKHQFLITNNSHLALTVRTLGLSTDILSSSFGKVPESTEDRYIIKYDGALLTWDGHPTGDSTAAAPVDQRWTSPGRNGKAYVVREQIEPAGARLLVGSLRIEGKGELARLLTGSPIRYVGPLVWGGSGQITYTP